MQRPGSAGSAEKAIVYTHIHLHRLLIKEMLDSKGVALALLCGGMDRGEQQEAVDVFQARHKWVRSVAGGCLPQSQLQAQAICTGRRFGCPLSKLCSVAVLLHHNDYFIAHPYDTTMTKRVVLLVGS